MPTIVIDKDSFDVWGKHPRILADFTFDASYPAGGEPLVASAFGMKLLKTVEKVGGNAAAGRLLFHFDTENVKLMCFYPTGGAQDSPAALADPDLSAGGATDNDSLIPGQGKEVLDTTDLSTITVRLQVTGLGT